MDGYSNILKQRNLKVTPQRAAILEYVMNSHSHPTADMIYSDLIKVYPSMSLATVYKTLDTLKNVNIILEINFGEDSNRYESNIVAHAHFKCVGCNDVFDIKLPDIVERIESEVSLCHNVRVIDRRIFFYGYCKNCDKT